MAGASSHFWYETVVDLSKARSRQRWLSFFSLDLMVTRPHNWLTVTASVVGMAIGMIGVQFYLDRHHGAAFDRALAETSSKLNATLPMQIDKYTRLDTTVPGPGKRLTYMYTISELSPQRDPNDILKTLRPSLVTTYKTSPQFALFRAQGVEMHYIYRDTSGKYIGEIVVTPKELR